MKKRFVVSTNGSSIEEHKLFIEFLDKSGLSFWHYLTDTWLIVDSKGNYTASSIRDSINQFFPGKYNLVIEMPSSGGGWAGFGPTGEGKSMFNWIRKNWS